MLQARCLLIEKAISYKTSLQCLTFNNHKMKKTLTYLLLASVVILSSCKDDDDSTVSISGSVVYDGTTTSLNNGLIVDYGEDVDYNEYNYDFYLSDGAIDYTATSYSEIFKGSIVVYLELYNEGSSFETGTYTFDGSSNYIASAYINTGGSFSSEVYAESGTVTVSGDDSNYTVTYELTFEDETTATGTVGGTFEIMEASSF